MFSGLNSLQYLNLAFNKLSSIDRETFVSLPRPLEISIWRMWGNDLECDDGLRGFQNEIDAGNMVLEVKMESLVDKFCDDDAHKDNINTDDTHSEDVYTDDRDCKCTHSLVFYFTFAPNRNGRIVSSLSKGPFTLSDSDSENKHFL